MYQNRSFQKLGAPEPPNGDGIHDRGDVPKQRVFKIVETSDWVAGSCSMGVWVLPEGSNVVPFFGRIL